MIAKDIAYAVFESFWMHNPVQPIVALSWFENCISTQYNVTLYFHFILCFEEHFCDSQPRKFH